MDVAVLLIQNIETENNYNFDSEFKHLCVWIAVKHTKLYAAKSVDKLYLNLS